MSTRRGFWFVVALLVAGLVVPVGTSSPASAAVSGSLKRVSADSTVLLGDTAKLTGRFAKAPRKRWVLQKATIGTSTWKTMALKGTTTTTGNLAVSFKPTGKAKYRARLAGTSRVTNAVNLPAVKGWRQVSSGLYHSCGIAYDRSAWCWGSNSQGRLGDPSYLQSDSRSPRRVLLPRAGAYWLSVQVGEGHSCGVLSDRSLWCWGSNLAGGLGVPKTGPGEDSHSTPQEVTAGAGLGWRSVSVGRHFTCAIKTDASLWCWGVNRNGNLTGADGIDTYDPRPARQVPTDAGLGFRSVSAGGFHACAMRTDNRLLCWGGDTMGQLGPVSLGNTYKTVPIIVPPAAGATTWASVRSGWANTCAAAVTGRLWCWGSNKYGQLGTSAGIGSSQAFDVPSPAPLDHTVSNYEVGMFTVCAISGARHQYCWGGNSHSQFGVESTENVATSPVPVEGAGVGWRAIATGATTVCGIAADHGAWCWGSNDRGQTSGAEYLFGHGPHHQRVPDPA